MQFIKKHGALISNLLVVLLVLAAIYVKIHETETAVLFRMEDAYIIVGAFLGLVVLRFLSGRNRSGKDSERK